MRDTFWPDWDAVTLKGSKYEDDHGKLYTYETLLELNSNGNFVLK